MLTPLLARLVTRAIRRPFWVIVVSLLLAVLSGYYVTHHFKISTDISQLIETEPDWAARGEAIDRRPVEGDALGHGPQTGIG